MEQYEVWNDIVYINPKTELLQYSDCDWCEVVEGKTRSDIDNMHYEDVIDLIKTLINKII